MQITSRRATGKISRPIVISVALLLSGIAAAIAFEQAPIALALVGLSIVPLLGYVTLRWPMIFPFGVYVLTVPFDPLLKAASGTGSTVTKFIGIFTILAMLYYAYRLRRLYAPPRSWYFWLVFLLWAFAGVIWSVEPDATLLTLQIVGSLFALYTVAAIFPIAARDYIYARRLVVASGVVTALYGVYAYFAGQRLGNARLTLQSGDLLIDPNHYAAYFSIPIAYLIARFFCLANLRERLFCIVLLIPMMINVLLTGSRGGLIAATIVIIYAGVRANKYVLLATSLVISFLMSFAIPNVWQRVFDPALQDASGRAEIWNTGLVALAHTGVFGSGFGTFAFEYDDLLHNSVQRTFAGAHRPAHNILIQTAVDLGVPGLLFLLAAWGTSIAQNRTVQRASEFFSDAIACEALMIGIFVSALTIDLVWFKYLWLGLLMVVLLANVTRPKILIGRPLIEHTRVVRKSASVRR